MIARAIASTSRARFFSVSASQVISKFIGESELKLRNIFDQARLSAPSIIFIDEIDALCPKRQDATDDLQKRLVATLLTLMDGIDASSSVMVLAATNIPNAVDSALRRPGRFDKEVEIGIPTASSRADILNLSLAKIPNNLSADQKLYISSNTHGYVGADIQALCRESVFHKP